MRRLLLPGHGKWRFAVPVIALLAGFLFATTKVTAAGTDLRAGSRLQLTDLISARQRDIALLTQTSGRAREAVEDRTAAQAASDARVAAARQSAQALADAAGLEPMSGAGLRVSLDDSKYRAGDPLPPGVPQPSPDDLVVHQQDVQAVVNALWAGGATAMTIMGQRVISTSAVKCVGNTLLLHGQVYSPPFVVQAIGKARAMRDALDSSGGVELFREYVDSYRLGYSVVNDSHLDLPAYEGTIELEHARAITP